VVAALKLHYCALFSTTAFLLFDFFSLHKFADRPLH
jgi:hypothetical protein